MELIRLISAVPVHMFMHRQTSVCSGPTCIIHRAYVAHLNALEHILLADAPDIKSLKRSLASRRIPVLQHKQSVRVQTLNDHI